MLLLVTIGLVVVGAVSLVIGFVSNSLGPIYLSIACSVIAGVVLVVFSRMARRQESAGAGLSFGAGSGMPAAPAPTGSSWAPRTETSPATPAPATPATPPPPPPRSAPAPLVDPTPAPPPPPSPRPEPSPVGRTAEPVTARMATAAPPLEDDFPIAGYESLRASQIVSELEGLSLDELDMVREREEQGKNRATVLRQVDRRIEVLEAEEEVEPEPAAPAEPFPAVADEEFEAAPAADDFPIPDYDDLSADEVIALLDDLDDDELDLVAEREERGLNRVEILDYIDDMFEEVGPDGQPVAAAAPAATAMPPVKKAPAKKAAVKKVAVKKAPVKKAAVKKAAVKAPAKKVAGRAATTAKAPVRKAAATAKAGAAAKKAAASPGTKAAAKKVAAKKAAPAKRR